MGCFEYIISFKLNLLNNLPSRGVFTPYLPKSKQAGSIRGQLRVRMLETGALDSHPCVPAWVFLDKQPLGIPTQLEKIHTPHFFLIEK